MFRETHAARVRACAGAAESLHTYIHVSVTVTGPAKRRRRSHVCNVLEFASEHRDRGRGGGGGGGAPVWRQRCVTVTGECAASPPARPPSCVLVGFSAKILLNIPVGEWGLNTHLRGARFVCPWGLVLSYIVT